VCLSFQKLLDYEVDSDDEWEEEEPGESLSHSEGVRMGWEAIAPPLHLRLQQAARVPYH
jgi:hypothetical protein